jgi:hypothetical protein
MDGSKRMVRPINPSNAWCFHWQHSNEGVSCLKIDWSESMGWLP